MILGANEPSMEMMFPTYVEVFLRITGLHRIALNFWIFVFLIVDMPLFQNSGVTQPHSKKMLKELGNLFWKKSSPKMGHHILHTSMSLVYGTNIHPSGVNWRNFPIYCHSPMENWCMENSCWSWKNYIMHHMGNSFVINFDEVFENMELFFLLPTDRISLLGTDISPTTGTILKMIFLFPRWDMDSFRGGYPFRFWNEMFNMISHPAPLLQVFHLLRWED